MVAVVATIGAGGAFGIFHRRSVSSRRLAKAILARDKAQRLRGFGH